MSYQAPHTPWKTIGIILTIAMGYSIIRHAASLLFPKDHVALYISAIFAISVDLPFVFCSLKLWHSIPGLPRWAFFLMGLDGFQRVMINTFILALNTGIITNLTANHFREIGYFLYFLLPLEGSIAWILILKGLKFPPSRDTWMHSLIIPCFISLVFIIYFFICQYWFFEAKSFSLLMLLDNGFILLLFLSLILSLSTARHAPLILLAEGYLLFIIANTFITPEHWATLYEASIFRGFLWASSKITLLAGAILLLWTPEKLPTRWFHPLNSIQPQIIMGGNSIATVVFLILILMIHYVFTPFSATLLATFSSLFIPLLGIFSLMLMEFSYYLTAPLRRLTVIVNQFEKSPERSLMIAQNKNEFNEFRVIERYILSKLKLVQKKSQTEKQLFHIATQVVHDIKSPLATLKMLSFEAEPFFNTEQQANFSNSLENIQVITTDFLKKYRYTQEDSHPKSKDHSSHIANLMKNIVREKSLTTKQARIELTISESAEQLHSTINPFAFTRIVSNLIDNAIEASLKDHIAHVCCLVKKDTKKNRLIIEIQDHGCGMTSKQIRTILAGKGVSTKKEGVGLGLKSVVWLINESDGKLAIHSEVGKGSTFTVTLPISNSTRVR